MSIVGEAGNGATALALIEATRPNIILLDNHLPDVPGPEVAKEIQRRRHPVHILAFADYENEASIKELLDNGVRGYVLYEESSEKIVEAVRVVADGGKWFSPRIMSEIVAWLSSPSSISDDLTTREAEVLRLLTQGLTNQQIAEHLSVTERTIRFHLQNLYAKLGVNRRGEAIAWAIDNGVSTKKLRETIEEHLSFPTG